MEEKDEEGGVCENEHLPTHPLTHSPSSPPPHLPTSLSLVHVGVHVHVHVLVVGVVDVDVVVLVLWWTRWERMGEDGTRWEGRGLRV